MTGDIIKGICAQVNRKLDGKGRLILPGDFREAAGFTPNEEVEVTLAKIAGKTALIVMKKEEKQC